jgi:C4-dicarboxylate-specific signal transduction histidine kinase
MVHTSALRDGLDMTHVLHDLVQPLTAIRALSAARPVRAAESECTEELRDRLRRIAELGDWMNDLLGSGVGPAPAAAEASEADAVQILQDVLIAAAASFQGSVRWRPSGTALVPVEPLELRRALGNVVDNAVRAAGPRGWVRAGVRRSRGRVSVEVEDSGPGFGRVAPQSSHGLAVTRSVVDRCGGLLDIGTGRAGGALVRLRLPLLLPDVPPLTRVW